MSTYLDGWLDPSGLLDWSVLQLMIRPRTASVNKNDYDFASKAFIARRFIR